MGLVVVTGIIWYWFSPRFTDVGYQPVQPIPYSHKLHVGELGLDCRYCHNTVEKAAHAAIPSTQVCMGCHEKLILPDSPKLAPLRISHLEDQDARAHMAVMRKAGVDESSRVNLPPIAAAHAGAHAQTHGDLAHADATHGPVEARNHTLKWTKVHMLPDYAYFNHSVHVSAGVGCKSCHGRIDQMDRVYQHEPLSMGWCLSCHRNPLPNLRPQDQVTNMSYDAVKEAYDPTKDPHRTRDVNPPTHCSGCHR